MIRLLPSTSSGNGYFSDFISLQQMLLEAALAECVTPERKAVEKKRIEGSHTQIPQKFNFRIYQNWNTFATEN
jgi:hypothetical protein